MKIAIFNLHIDQEQQKTDLKELNQFIEKHNVLSIEQSFVNEEEKYWSIIVQYESLKNKIQEKEEKTINPPLSTSEYSQLLERLKTWRGEKAKQQKIPAYFIASNHQLEQVALLQPYKKEDLMELKGFGKFKIENYGDDIIAIITAYQKNQCELMDMN